MRTAARRAQAAALRVLIIGPVNSLHVEDFARAIHSRGIDVFVAGDAWGGGLPASRLAEAGITVLSPTRPTTLWLRRLMRELRPSVVHAHWLPYAVLGRLAGARPLVATAWGSDVHLASRRQRWEYRWLLRRADAVLADSHHLLAELQRLGAPAARSSIFSWGVDLEAFSPPSRPREELRRELGVRDGPLVLSVRGFKAIYNPEVVIAAFEQLAERRADLQLVLKHNSDEEPRVPVFRYPDRVRVVGPQPREVLADWYRAASVCLSLASTDSSPRSVWEAMACACPCVLSDLPWAREELQAGHHALVAPIAAGPVAGAVARVLEEPGLARELGSRGRAHVEAHHDREREMEKVIRLYRKLAELTS